MYREAEWQGADLTLLDDEQPEFLARVDQMLRTGEPPPERTFDFEEPDELPEFFEIISLTVAPEGVIGQGRIAGREIQIQVPAEAIGPERQTDFAELLVIA